MNSDEEQTQADAQHLVRERIAKADHLARAVLEMLGDKRCPGAKDQEDPDVVESIIMDLDVLLQRLEFITDIVQKL